MFLIVGGTRGLGLATAIALAKRNRNVTIAGRDEERGNRIVQELKQINPSGIFAFKSIDLSIIQHFNFDSCFDGVVITAGLMNWNRTITRQGLDQEMAVHYYGRWNLLQQLLSKDLLTPTAHVVSVLAAGQGTIDKNNIDLRKKLNFITYRTTAAAYNDAMVIEFAKRYPQVFIHMFPGLVSTDLARNMFFPIPLFSKMFGFLLTNPQVAGERIANTLFQNLTGSNLLDYRGEVMNKTRDEKSCEMVWNHTSSTIDRLLSK